MATATEPTADEAKAAKEAEKAAKDAERKAKAEQREAERQAKAKEREEAKAAKEKERAEAKAAAAKEKVDKAMAELPEDKRPTKGTGDGGTVTLGDVREAIKAWKAEERANKPKLAPLTLSQRRAMLVLADGPVVPKSGFNALPLDYLVSVGLAQKEEVLVDETYTETEGTGDEKKQVEKTRSVPKTQYSLTDDGVARVEKVNPKWKTWKPDTATATESTPAV